MIVKKVPSEYLPIYTFTEAMNLGIKKLLLTAPFGRVFILNDNSALLGYYSFKHYKDSGTFDIQLDTVCLQEDEIDAEQNDTSLPLSIDGTDLGIVPIISVNGKVTGAAFCADDAWYKDKSFCLSMLEYLDGKDLSLEYWFLAKKYKKVAFWGLDELSLAFANRIRRYRNIEVLGIYENRNLKAHLTIDYLNHDTDVHFVETIENVFDLGADLVIVTDWAMRHLEDLPGITNAHTDVLYAPRILDLHSPGDLYDAQNIDIDLLKDDVTRYVNAEMTDRFKAKYNAMGCSFLRAAIPNRYDLNIQKEFNITDENIARWVAEQNGWEPEGREIEEFSIGRNLITRSIIKNAGKIYGADVKTRYVNAVNKSRVVLNAPAEYKNTVYLVGPCVVGSFFCTDEQTLGYFLQENLNNCGLEYRVVPIHMIINADIYYHMKVLEEFDIREGDVIFQIDSKNVQSEWDLDLTPVFRELYEKHGDGFFMDQPIHCAKEGAKAIADFLIRHIGDPIASGTAPRTQTQAHSGFTGNPQLKKYQEFIRSNAIHRLPRIGSIVMNCNPFTLGHLHLIEHAARQVDYLYVFIVEEDRSFFRFEDRIELAKAGTAHLENVKLLPSGQFIISAITFSEYFDKANLEGTAIDPSLDVETFGSQIAPCLNISVRFVGEEPFDPVTAQYNQSMKEILPKYGVELREIPRKDIDGEAISASRVRKYLEEKNWDEIKKLVPETTYLFLEEKFG